MSNVKIEASWKAVLAEEFEKEYFAGIRSYLLAEKAAGKVIYPPGPLIFNAFDTTPFHAVKAVILGQDPYHNPGQAMGLSFSVPRGIPKPASMRNIYQELQSNYGIPIAPHGDLTKWAQQGVLMLNAMLTVEHNRAGSHANIGWQFFTDAVIQKLSEQRSGIVFMLWGNYAKSKAKLIDDTKHHVLTAAHPSPLAGTAFLGCQHFKWANELLTKQGITPIDWDVN